MLTYVSLYKWTDSGIKAVKDTVERAEKNMAMSEEVGCRIVGFYWTQGAYDLVVITEWPDEDTAQAFFLKVASADVVRSETLRAFNKADMRRILSKLG
jgi:uncharacterized protein with GYD domain